MKTELSRSSGIPKVDPAKIEYIDQLGSRKTLGGLKSGDLSALGETIHVEPIVDTGELLEGEDE